MRADLRLRVRPLGWKNRWAFSAQVRMVHRPRRHWSDGKDDDVPTVLKRETSGAVLNADEWKRAETRQVGIFGHEFVGLGTFLFHRTDSIQGPTVLTCCWTCSLTLTFVPVMWWTACSLTGPFPTRLSVGLLAKVHGIHVLISSWETAQSSTCWFVRFLEDKVSSKPEVGKLSLKNLSVNILGLQVKRENSRILSGGIYSHLKGYHLKPWNLFLLGHRKAGGWRHLAQGS